MATGRTMRGEINGGRIRVCTVDEEGEQLLVFELDDTGLLNVLIADLVDGEPVERIRATLATLDGPSPLAPLARFSPVPLDLTAEAA